MRAMWSYGAGATGEPSPTSGASPELRQIARLRTQPVTPEIGASVVVGRTLGTRAGRPMIDLGWGRSIGHGASGFDPLMHGSKEFRRRPLLDVRVRPPSRQKALVVPLLKVDVATQNLGG